MYSLRDVCSFLGLVVLFHFFNIYFFDHTLQYMQSYNSLRPLSISSQLQALWADPQWCSEPRFELGPALQQACVLPCELRSPLYAAPYLRLSELRCPPSELRCPLSKLRYLLSEPRCSLSELRCPPSELRCTLSEYTIPYLGYATPCLSYAVPPIWAMLPHVWATLEPA